MLFAVLLTDKPDHGALRAQHLDAHVRWVDEHKGTVLVAGSLRHDLADVPKGGLWIVDAESSAAVFELVTSDPFHRCGLRQRVEVFHWSKALPAHRALV